MRFTLFLGAILFSLAACQQAEEPAGTAAETETATAETTDSTAMTEPRAEKRPHEMTLHGVTRNDNYYWLHDDSRSDPEVIAYLEQENEWFDAAMEHT